MTLLQKLDNYHIVLASASPRRQELLRSLRIPFEVRTKPIAETYPPALQGHEIVEYLANRKAEAFGDLQPNEILITGDTLVWQDGKALEKPRDAQEAHSMLQALSGQAHQVHTGLCFRADPHQITVHDTTLVWFERLTEAEIADYVKTFEPFDKAGAYGIQEWIGHIGISKIEGSYNNVVGLPTHLVYKTLNELVNTFDPF